ncbi:serine/threonine-protein kinase [Arthrobacter sp. PvP102]|uniref:Stk1 family PASTA domain-containing Ser/Thr kinase n=1 Tax=unclassified Arthrobacter TaxID=235627 RepID=UPI001B4A92B8|nr:MULTISPECIES: Stk1 family PASTA domain-containing Ser/Thr kinase [unclassified Arthrobacter]MBP1233571.1 serine/threonine-protein kinase [Arthrobacter sp. PvP103]MBP1238706.1 serine/threonine-protein kinase [Arthrobacter sp. PvP102]
MNTQRVLNGRYELGELIGRGGMADVHRGLDTRLGRTVAIKLLRPDLARDPQFQARFKREAQAVAALNHPSIVAIYDTGDHAVPGGPEDTVRVPYIVMEFVSGKTLRDLIRAKEVSIDHAIDFTLGVLSALEYSHRAGIVHRDIKPANVMFCEDSDTIKVMDFGIARAMADSSATMTQTQAVVGTAQYLSPEQARGETVDARSDLYSAACLLYEMLTGRPPFIGDSPVSVAYQHVREIPEPASSLNPEVSEALDSVLSKALQKNRADRFQDAAAFRRALRAARNGIPVPDVAAGEAPTDPNNTVPAGERTALAAPYSLTGASFLDDSPSGRLRPVHDTLGDDQAIPAQVYEPSESSDLPLGFPPERERTPRQKSRRRTWIATLVIFTLLVLAGGGLWLYNMMNQAPPPVAKVEVPAVSSLTESEALQRLYNARLSPQITRLPHDTITKGTAIGTVPAAGTAMEPDSKVTLNISDGPSAVKIPDDLPGRTEAAARDVLRQIGLAGAPGTTMANSATVPTGIVITTKPAPGQTVAVGSTVEIVVSTGKVAMPELRGLPRAEAETALKNLGLGIDVKEVENSEVEPGKVTEQSDAVNSLVEQGKTISIIVAKAPAPSPKPTPTPTPTPTETSRDRG